MTAQGKMNIFGIVIMPAVAMLTGIVMFGPRLDTMITVFSLNMVPMLIGGLISGLLLNSARKAGGAGRSMALWPTLIPAVVGIVWYLSDALFPAESDPGRVYIAGPQYLLGLAILVGIVAAICCAIARSRRNGV